MDADSFNANGLAWAVSRWNDEVKNRPLVNVHRRTLDDTWRQVIRYFDGDPDKLIGPSHDVLLAREQEARAWKPPAGVKVCPESGKHCLWVDGECQTCGITAPPGTVDWCGQCDRPASACAKDGAHRTSGVGGKTNG